MRNLAGVSDCDRYIEIELERARIPAEQALAHRSEVPYTIAGRLGNITFKRAWTYWVTDGLVPIETAEELYADPVGKTDIRVAGHCGAPEPQEWATWFTTEGRQVFPAKEEALYLGLKERNPDWELPEDLFSDNPEALGANLGINTYHIDSEVGLRIFADAIQANLREIAGN